jgi:hypothetical protein
METRDICVLPVQQAVTLALNTVRIEWRAAHYSADFVVLLHGPFVGAVCLNAVRYLLACLFVTKPPSRKTEENVEVIFYPSRHNF